MKFYSVQRKATMILRARAFSNFFAGKQTTFMTYNFSWCGTISLSRYKICFHVMEAAIDSCRPMNCEMNM